MYGVGGDKYFAYTVSPLIIKMGVYVILFPNIIKRFSVFFCPPLSGFSVFFRPHLSGQWSGRVVGEGGPGGWSGRVVQEGVGEGARGG